MEPGTAACVLASLIRGELGTISTSETIMAGREHASTATLDENFAKDVAAAIESHPEPLKPPAWD